MIVGAELADQRHDILAEALGVGCGMARFEDAAIDAAAQVLDEGAEQALIGPSDGEVTVQANVDVTHGRQLRWTGLRVTGPSS